MDTKQKRIIKVLIAALIISVTLLLCVHFNNKYSIIKNNIVYADGKNTVTLSSESAKNNVPFEAYNMFPGDVVNNEYELDVYYKGDIELHFSIDNFIDEGLKDILFFNIKYDDVIIFDDFANKLPEQFDFALSSKKSTTEHKDFVISVSLDTSVGNEYQDKQMKCGFEWWVEGGEGHLIPKTGIDGNGLIDSFSNPNVCAFIIAILGIVFLVFLKRRKNDYE